MINCQLVIIGGGSAGMASALKAYQEGIKDIIIIEKDDKLGGILNQCIHDGFGLDLFKEELSGPEYAYRFIQEIEKLNIRCFLSTFILGIDNDFNIKILNKDGVEIIKAHAIIFAAGCYERNAGAINLMGDRPSGIMSAGTAQKYLNIKGYMPSKRVVILGSGDIGLITARRMTLEGAKVLAVLEIMPYSNGLTRNIKQCLDDFNIPLYLSTTVKQVIGKSRLEKVIACRVDENGNFIDVSEIEFDCDTLLLSVGLIPNIGLIKDMGIRFSSTRGPVVDELLQTDKKGLFACGNCLHVHDLVDHVTNEGYLAGLGASLFLKNKIKENLNIEVVAKNYVSYVVPSYINTTLLDNITLKFRVKKPLKNVNIVISDDKRIIKRIPKLTILPSQMENIVIKTLDLVSNNGKIYVDIEMKI